MVTNKNGGGGLPPGGDPPKKNWIDLGSGHKNDDKQSYIEQLLNKSIEDLNKQKLTLDKISSNLDDTLKQFENNEQNLKKITHNYNNIIKDNETKTEEISETTQSVIQQQQANENTLTDSYNQLNCTLKDYVKANQTGVEHLEKDVSEEIVKKKDEILNNVKTLTENNLNQIDNKINNRIDNIRSSIDEIILRSINNALNRVINFVLSFGGLFDTRFYSYIIITIIIIGAGSYMFKSRAININLTAPPQIQAAPTPIIEIPMQQPAPNNTTNNNEEPSTEVSLLRSALIKMLKILNKWLEKKIDKLNK